MYRYFVKPIQRQVAGSKINRKNAGFGFADLDGLSVQQLFRNGHSSHSLAQKQNMERIILNKRDFSINQSDTLVSRY